MRLNRKLCLAGPFDVKYEAAESFEQTGNWKQAKESCWELLRDSPDVTFADGVKQQLAVHPE